MSVYFRTGENTGASIPWPVYLFVVLPVQLLVIWPLKLVGWTAKALAAGTVAVWVSWNERKPPHPEG